LRVIIVSDEFRDNGVPTDLTAVTAVCRGAVSFFRRDAWSV